VKPVTAEVLDLQGFQLAEHISGRPNTTANVMSNLFFFAYLRYFYPKIPTARPT